MPSIYKKNGKGNYYVSFYDANGRRVEKSSRTTDRRAAERLARELEHDALRAREGLIDPAAERLRDESRRAVTEHVNAYRDAMVAAGSSGKHIDQTIKYINGIVASLNWTTAAEIRAEVVAHHLRTQQQALDRSARWFNAQLIAIKGFTRWMFRHGRLATDPLATLSRVKETADRRRARRAISARESESLVSAAESAPTVQYTRDGKKLEMSGDERAALYDLMLGTGLRQAEATSLTPSSFEFDCEGGPVVTVAAAYSKRRRDDVLPLPQHVARRLQRLLKKRDPAQLIWILPHKPVDRMLRPDLARAGIEYEDAAGRRVDFHALRHTFVTRLQQSGVTLSVVKHLARHSSSSTLTEEVYTHLGIADDRRALEQAFGSTPDASEAQRATGTDGRAAEEHLPDLQQRLQQSGRESMQSGAIRCDDDRHGIVGRIGAQTNANAGDRNEKRPITGRFTSRGGEIRTPDLLTPSQTR